MKELRDENDSLRGRVHVLETVLRAALDGEPWARRSAELLLEPRPSVCTTPNGRTDGHGAYVERNASGDLVCAFCKKSRDVPRPSEAEQHTDVTRELLEILTGRNHGHLPSSLPRLLRERLAGSETPEPIVEPFIDFMNGEVSAQTHIAAWLRTTPRAGGVQINIGSSQDIARLADAIEAGEWRTVPTGSEGT